MTFTDTFISAQEANEAYKAIERIALRCTGNPEIFRSARECAEKIDALRDLLIAAWHGQHDSHGTK